MLAIDCDKTLELHKNDANHSFNSFYLEIEKLLNIYAPLKKVSNKEHKRIYKLWITNGIIKSITQRKKLFNSYVKCKNSERKIRYFTSYKALRNQINALIKSSKENFYANYFSNNNKNLRKIWKGIKEIINIKSKSNDYPTCITSEKNTTITDPVEISKNFNKYFSNIADSILNKRKYNGKKIYSDYLPDPSPNSIKNQFHDTNGSEVFNIISKFNINKSSGPTSIPTKILKLIKFEISKPLAQIINLSFSTGIHPDRLKIAQVIPIFKKGSKLLTSNYRPISLLSNLNKI